MKTIAEFVNGGIKSLSDLEDALQTAVRLEFSTIPPYLCAQWSILEEYDPDGVAMMLEGIVKQEMYHFALVGNILSAIGRTPKIARRDFLPTYPTHELPGGIYQALPVDLKPISPAQIEVFMQIEYPEFTPVAARDADAPATIGDFYNAIVDGLNCVNPTFDQSAYYISFGKFAHQIKNMTDAIDAISKIKDEGEGTSDSPDQRKGGSQFAHYYLFKEVFSGQRLVQTEGEWGFAGDGIQFPAKQPFKRSPAGSPTFNKAMSQLLLDLQACWSSGTPLKKSLDDMADLEKIGRDLIMNGICPEFLWADPVID